MILIIIIIIEYKRKEKGYNNTNKTRHSKTTYENSPSKLGEMARQITNNQMQENLKNFGVKYGNQENITKKLNG